MFRSRRRAIPVLILLSILTASLAAAVPSPAVVRGQGLNEKAANEPYLELSVTPALAAVGDLITLNITYHNLGEPYLYAGASPDGLVTTDPPITMPCPYCTSVTYRALAAGQVTFRAGATGEIYDEGCHCWRWSGGSDNRPVTVTIVDRLWKVFMPILQR
jgi:hypothetical protein